MSKLPILIIFIGFISSSFMRPAWGFFGHKRINRLAVFTLPSNMMPLFKKEIEYITDHAVDPDKRRYVVPTEGYRHYINLDRWSFLPHNSIDAQILHTDVYVITDKNDTLQLVNYAMIRKHKRDYFLKSKAIRYLFSRDSIAVSDSFYRRFFIHNVAQIQFDTPLSISPDSLKILFKKEQLSMKSIKAAFAQDRLTQHGILPYHLQKVYYQLRDAFIKKDKNRILKLSAEMGHYIGDAHVPLHTVSNYDGQFTQQNGLHSFWESRLPELFADNQYNFFVGRAEYVSNIQEFMWKIILDANKLSKDILAIEKELSQTFPSDKKYCLETINGLTIQKPCFDYAKAFHDKLGGMVETQMKAAILNLGSIWYTAWVEAGQPDLEDLKIIEPVSIEKKELHKADSLMHNNGKMLGRDEGN